MEYGHETASPWATRVHTNRERTNDRKRDPQAGRQAGRQTDRGEMETLEREKRAIFAIL